MDLPQVAGPSVGSCNKVKLQVSRELLAPEEQHKGKEYSSLTSCFFSYYLKIQGPKYMTIGPDQSPLISTGVLALTLIGCESSPSPSRMYGSPAQPISIHILFFYLFHTLFTVCEAERQFISFTQ